MIKEIRKKKNLTQLQLALKIGINFSYLSKLENYPEKHSPSVDIVFKLSNELELDPCQLMYFFYQKSKKKNNALISGVVTKVTFNKLTKQSKAENTSINNIVSKIVNEYYK